MEEVAVVIEIIIVILSVLILTLVFCWIVSYAQEDWYKKWKKWPWFKAWDNLKKQRVALADWLEAWGKKHGLYAVPTISTVQIRRELLRTPFYTDKEKHIKSIIRKFMVNQPTSIHIILEDIKEDFPTEYSIALPEYEAILDEKYRHKIN